MSFIYLISDLTEFNVTYRMEGRNLFYLTEINIIQIHGTKFCRETSTGGQPVRFSREQDCFAASNDLQHGTTPTINITVSFSGKYSLNLTRFPPWKRQDFHHKETSGKRSLWLISRVHQYCCQASYKK